MQRDGKDQYQQRRDDEHGQGNADGRNGHGREVPDAALAQRGDQADPAAYQQRQRQCAQTDGGVHGQSLRNDLIDADAAILERGPKVAVRELSEIAHILTPDGLVQVVARLDGLLNRRSMRLSASNGPPGAACSSAKPSVVINSIVGIAMSSRRRK